jgi:N-acetyl-anhydromuramyl-L-alanine amidase AmpD
MAVWIGSSNFSAGRRGWRPEAIVIHVMDGSLSGTDSWFNNPASAVSAHYGIGKDGEIHQYVKESDTAYHAGTVVNPTWIRIRKDARGRYINPNYYTIGIEHAGWGENVEPWAAQQREASLGLVRIIAERWAIPLDSDHIIPHREIRSSKPNCPGKGLDFSAYLADLGATAQTRTAPAFPERPLHTQVRAITTLNVRAQPATLGLAPRRLLAGDQFDAVAVTEGEPHLGNRNWYRNSASDFIWAGGTDLPFPEEG